MHGTCQMRGRLFCCADKKQVRRSVRQRSAAPCGAYAALMT
jgi:hypothetical protein